MIINYPLSLSFPSPAISATSSALFGTSTAEMWKRLGLQLPPPVAETPPEANNDNYETVNDDISAAKRRAIAANEQQQNQVVLQAANHSLSHELGSE